MNWWEFEGGSSLYSSQIFGPNVRFLGGGSGGGGSGAVSYPDYMQTVHSDWLDNTGVDTITSSITDLMNAALGNSPWVAQSAYSPDAAITAYENGLTTFSAILAGITETTDWAALYAQAVTSIADVDGITEAVIVADVDAFADQLDDEITTKVLPRFRRGMQDINAVISSAFPIGESIIEGFRNRDVAKHNSAIRLTAVAKNAEIELGLANVRVSASKLMLHLMLQRISWEDGYMKSVIEANRIKIVAKKEENDVEMDIDDKDALWDLEVFQYGANMLASIGGGTGSTRTHKPSTAQSVIGGALSGAAAGAMVGMAGGPGAVITAPIGAAIGGILGAASGLL